MVTPASLPYMQILKWILKIHVYVFYLVIYFHSACQLSSASAIYNSLVVYNLNLMISHLLTESNRRLSAHSDLYITLLMFYQQN